MIDWDRVAELREDIGGHGFEEVIDLFFTEVETAIDALPDANDRGAALHFIKGCALNLGLVDLADLCQNGADDQRVTSAFQEVRAELMAGLA